MFLLSFKLNLATHFMWNFSCYLNHQPLKTNIGHTVMNDALRKLVYQVANLNRHIDDQ